MYWHSSLVLEPNLQLDSIPLYPSAFKRVLLFPLAIREYFPRKIRGHGIFWQHQQAIRKSIPCENPNSWQFSLIKYPALQYIARFLYSYRNVQPSTTGVAPAKLSLVDSCIHDWTCLDPCWNLVWMKNARLVCKRECTREDSTHWRRHYSPVNGGAGGSFTQTLKTISAVEQKGLACATSRSKGTQ